MTQDLTFGRWGWLRWPRRLIPLAAIGMLAFLIWQDVAQLGAGLLILSADEAASQGEPATALERLQWAQLLAPDLPQAADREAVLLHKPPASASAPSMDRAYAPALNNRAVLEAKGQDPQVTLALLTQADGAGMAVAEIQFNLGVAALAAGERDQAVVALQRAAALRPGWGQPWQQVAPLYLKAGDLPRAEVAASQALALGASDYGTYQVLIQALLGQEKWAEGLDAVDATQVNFPQSQDGSLSFYKALLLRGNGQTAEAVATLRQAFFAAKENGLRRRISDELRALTD